MPVYFYRHACTHTQEVTTVSRPLRAKAADRRRRNMAKIPAYLPSHARRPLVPQRHTPGVADHLKGPATVPVPHTAPPPSWAGPCTTYKTRRRPQPTTATPFLRGSCKPQRARTLQTASSQASRRQSPLCLTTALSPEPCHRGSDPRPVPSFHPANPSLQPRCAPHVQGVK